jgi:hypothetical protein
MGVLRISGGHDGIKEYLEKGKKQGRENTRDELDERLILAGDLEVTDKIIQNMDTNAERYLHCSFSLKEDEVSPELLKQITQEFEAFTFSAYGKDEYCFYAEAHLPKIESTIGEENGLFISRKPHIHFVIPKVNLLSGQTLNPFGMVKMNEKFIDAFQEHINNKFGLASPKENRRLDLTSQADLLSRVKGDIFSGQSKEFKGQMLAEMISRKIEKYEDYQGLLGEYGQRKTVNAGKANEYENVTLKGESKGINLNGNKAGQHVFSKEFIELPTAEKQRSLVRDLTHKFQVAGEARRDPETIEKALTEWHTTRAKEIKYLNSGGKENYSTYRKADPEQRQQILVEREALFYANNLKGIEKNGQRNRSTSAPLDNRPGRSHGDASRQRTGANRGTGRNASPGKPYGQSRGQGTPPISINAVRTLSAIPVVRFAKGTEVLLPGDARHQLEHGRAESVDGLRRPHGGDHGTGVGGINGTGRAADNIVSQFKRDHLESAGKAAVSRNPEMQEIKQKLDARRLLAELSHTHGVILEKYAVTKGKDGGDRIVCGTRNLNVSDFLTDRLKMPWTQAQQILRTTYAAQKSQEREYAPKQEPRRSLWAEFQAERKMPTSEQRKEARKEAQEQQKAISAGKMAAIKTEFYAKRSQAQSDTRLTPAARKAAVSIARMQRLDAELNLRIENKSSREQTKPVKTADLYKDFLTEKAQKGDELALAELRRQQEKVPENAKETEAHIGAGVAHPKPDLEPIHKAEALSYQVHNNGDVTYRRNGEDVLRDQGRSVRMLKTDEQAIETGLRLAQQKFGNTLALTGSNEFKENTARIAADAGLRVKFTDEKLNDIMRERTAEIATSRVRGAEARKMAQDFANQRVKESIKPAPAEVTKADVSKEAEVAKDMKSTREPAIKSELPQKLASSQYTGEVHSIDDKNVYQSQNSRSGQYLIRHERKHFDELPKPGDTVVVKYDANGVGSVKNRSQDLGKEKDQGMQHGM